MRWAALGSGPALLGLKSFDFGLYKTTETLTALSPQVRGNFIPKKSRTSKKSLSKSPVVFTRGLSANLGHSMSLPTLTLVLSTLQ